MHIVKNYAATPRKAYYIIYATLVGILLKCWQRILQHLLRAHHINFQVVTILNGDFIAKIQFRENFIDIHVGLRATPGLEYDEGELRGNSGEMREQGDFREYQWAVLDSWRNLLRFS